jgi:DNA polymerase III alpha subunit
MKTELKDRVLFFDGTSQVTPDLVPDLLLAGVPISKIAVTEEDDEVKTFNLISDDETILVGHEVPANFDLTWNIPKKYDEINLSEHLHKILSTKFPDPEKRIHYAKRLDEEIHEIQKRGLDKLIKALIFVVDKFNESGIVYGVGRGSSCASLVLFLIGLHMVDPIKYRIPMTEFFHD